MTLNWKEYTPKPDPAYMKLRFSTTRHVTPPDKAALFKTGVKEILSRHELVATLWRGGVQTTPVAATPAPELVDLEGNTNLFADESDPQGMSQTMKHYIAGQIAAMPQMMALICPTINAYKRNSPQSLGTDQRLLGNRKSNRISPRNPRYISPKPRAPNIAWLALTPTLTSRWPPALPPDYTA